MIIFSRHCLARIIFLLLTLGCCAQPVLALDTPAEQSVRAAMVFNFLKFTELPLEGVANTRQLRLCIAVGDSRQTEALAALSGRKVKGRELIISRLSGQGDDCHVLYVDTRQRWNAAAANNAFQHTLTISAYPGFAQDGGIIEIVLQEDGTRFDINLAAGRRVGIYFAPQLLRLARHVHE